MNYEPTEYVYEDSGSDAIKWVSIGFGIGLLVGGIVGLLMAPKSGDETREQLKGYASDLSEKTKDLASNLSDKSKDYASTVTEKVSQATMTAKDAAKSAASVAQDYIRAGKEAVTNVASAIRSTGNGMTEAESIEAEPL